MKTFGHVGDPESKAEAATEIPRFDQTHVNYLKKIYLSDHAFAPASQDDMVKLASWAAMDAQAREIILHIQALVDGQKGSL